MINAILSNENLKIILSDEVRENSVFVSLDSDFYFDDGKLNYEKIVNLSVDTYYNSLGLSETPPSIDNLLVIDRGDNKYSLYLIELKDVKKLRRISNENIRAKFDTSINDFMMVRFYDEFNIEGSKVTDLNLWLVCNRFKFIEENISDEDYEKRIRCSVIERLMMIPPFRYRGKIGIINFMYKGAEVC